MMLVNTLDTFDGFVSCIDQCCEHRELINLLDSNDPIVQNELHLLDSLVLKFAWAEAVGMMASLCDDGLDTPGPDAGA